MPHTDPEKRREYRQEYYPKYYEANREKVIKAIKNRKYGAYSGRCVVCGAVTPGQSKNQPGSRFCKNHRRELWAEKKKITKDK